ncbi:HAD domain-containing protein [Rhizohabitans arisaemae]|uniref:HAD domain-containing protein n=1 Tax=Rhizohabitans arisaemae TaxID=2720610 RepID=UPI0024B2830B|nr:HAD domain-containing protein [Rhizohabitans arisaemae]
MSSARPLVLLDVDGVLNPTSRTSLRLRRHECVVDGQTYRVLLDRRHGAWLLALAGDTGAELVWATTWEHHANEHISPRLGLPPLPVVDVNRDGVSHYGEGHKTGPIAEYAGSRPFVWFDDAVGGGDRTYLLSHEQVGDFLIVKIPPRTGLTRDHLTQARTWLTRRPG